MAQKIVTSGTDQDANFDAGSQHYRGDIGGVVDQGGGSASMGYGNPFTTNSYGYTQGTYDANSIKNLQQFGSNFAQAQPGDYSKFNNSLASAAMSQLQGTQAGGYQQAAMMGDAAIANGSVMSPAYQTAANAAAQGMNYQQAVAGSAMGGSLGQAAALRQNAQGMAAYQAGSNQQLQSLAASEQAAAAQRYAASANALRQGNMAGIDSSMKSGQAYAQNTTDQGNFYNQQRSLADQGNLYGQNAALQENISNYNQQQSEATMNEADLESQRKANQASNSVIGSVIGSSVGAAGAALSHGSDIRTKEPVSLGYAAHRSMMR